jgi:hypothetical protein
MVCFTFLQLFFNFGANTTTFIGASLACLLNCTHASSVPAEVFPTRVRGFAHGFSAACGKCGAIIASLGFATARALSRGASNIWLIGIAEAHIGTANVLWIFFGSTLSLLIPRNLLTLSQSPSPALHARSSSRRPRVSSAIMSFDQSNPRSGVDADVVDLEERQAAAGMGQRAVA